MKIEVLRAMGLCKKHAGKTALKGFALSLYQGEILGLVGLNGAGKTTLANILSGETTTDSGTIFIDDQPEEIGTMLKAQSLGIHYIGQRSRLIPNLTIAENICLVKPGKRTEWRVNNKKIQIQTEELLNEYGITTGPKTKAGKLTLAEQHIILLAKAMFQKAIVIILDDITSIYSDREWLHLSEILKKVQFQSVSVILVESKLDSIMDIAHRIVLIKGGKNAGNFFKDEFDKGKIEKILMGDDFVGSTIIEKACHKDKKTVLEVSNLCSENMDDLSFYLKAGEIIGFINRDGSMFSEAVQVLSGRKKADTGEILVSGVPVRIASPGDSIRSRIGYLSGDFKLSTFSNLNILENLSMPCLYKFSNKLGHVKKGMLKLAYNEYKMEMGLEEKDCKKPLYNLNVNDHDRYKLLVYRWLVANVNVLLIEQPFTGTDIMMKRLTYQVIQDCIDKEMGIIFCSPNMSDIINLCNRVYVIEDGQAVNEHKVGQKINTWQYLNCYNFV